MDSGDYVEHEPPRNIYEIWLLYEAASREASIRLDLKLDGDYEEFVEEAAASDEEIEGIMCGVSKLGRLNPDDLAAIGGQIQYLRELKKYYGAVAKPILDNDERLKIREYITERLLGEGLISDDI